MALTMTPAGLVNDRFQTWNHQVANSIVQLRLAQVHAERSQRLTELKEAKVKKGER